MHFRSLKTLIIGMLAMMLLVGIALPGHSIQPAHAQTTDWSIWIVNTETSEMTHLDLAGTILHTLPFPTIPGEEPLEFSAAISPDSTIAATCSKDSTNNVTLGVFDLTTGKLLHSHPLGLMIHCTLSPHSFSDDGTRLAYGALYDFYDARPQVPWKFEVMDVTSGATITALDPNDPALINDNYLGVPGSVYFSGDLIVFTMEPYATDGVGNKTSYTFRLS